MKIKNKTTVSNRIKRHETTFDYDKIKNNNNNKKSVQIFKHEYDIKRPLKRDDI